MNKQIPTNGQLQSENAFLKRLSGEMQRKLDRETAHHNRNVDFYSQIWKLVRPSISQNWKDDQDILDRVAGLCQRAEQAEAEAERLKPIFQWVEALSRVEPREVGVISSDNMARELRNKSEELIIDYRTASGAAVIYLPKPE